MKAGFGVGELLYFEDFPVGQTREFCRHVLTADQIASYAAEFDALLGAQVSEHRLPTASPWQLCALLMRLNYDGWMNAASARGAPGVDEVRWFRPVTAGETLSARFTVRNARVSRSRPQLGLIQYYYELLGDGGQPVLSQLNSVMMELRNPQALQTGNVASSAAVSNRVRRAPLDESASVALGAADFPADAILAFGHAYDPQPFHIDADAARTGPFGALAASGWHTAACWARAYATSFAAGTPALPRPDRLLWLKPLHWRRPTFAGDRIAFDFVPGAIERRPEGQTLMTAAGRGRNAAGETVIEFTLGMTVST